MKKKLSGETNIKDPVQDGFREDLGWFVFDDSLNIYWNSLQILLTMLIW